MIGWVLYKLKKDVILFDLDSIRNLWLSMRFILIDYNKYIDDAKREINILENKLNDPNTIWRDETIPKKKLKLKDRRLPLKSNVEKDKSLLEDDYIPLIQNINNNMSQINFSSAVPDMEEALYKALEAKIAAYKTTQNSTKESSQASNHSYSQLSDIESYDTFSSN